MQKAESSQDRNSSI